MSDTGEKTCGVANPDGDWSNWTPTQLGTSDNNRATSGTAGNPAAGFATTFGFGIPGGSIIDGIEAILECIHSGASGTRTCDLRVSGDAGNTWTAVKSVEFPTVEADKTAGSPTDDWGWSWGANGMSDANFQLEVRRNESLAAVMGIDYLRVKVTYSPGGRQKIVGVF